jgi:hypothetical protein
VFVLVGATGFLLYKQGYISLNTKSYTDTTKKENIASEISTEIVKTEEELALDQTTTLNIPAIENVQQTENTTVISNSCFSELANGWELATDANWYMELGKEAKVSQADTQSFVSFFNKAIAYMKSIKSYNYTDHSIGYFKGYNNLLDRKATVIGDTAVMQTVGCKGTLDEISGNFTCSEPKTTYYEKEILSESNPCLMIEYSKEGDADWVQTISPFNKVTGYSGIASQTNPLNILGLNSNSGSIVYVVGAKAGGKVDGPKFGEAIDIVYIQTIRGSERYYYALNLMQGKIYRILEYGPNDYQAEYIYSNINEIDQLPE